MWDITLEIIRVVIVGSILGYLWRAGRRMEVYTQKGWRLILVGISLVFIGTLFDLTDNFEQLNPYVIIGDTPYEAFIEKVIGYILGDAFIALGFYYWLPLVVTLKRTEKDLKRAHDELEIRVEERTADLLRSNSLLTATLESTADGILVMNSKGQWSDFNQRFLQMWHIPESISASGNDKQAFQFTLNELKEPKAFAEQLEELNTQPETERFDSLEFKDERAFEWYPQPQKIAGKNVGRVWSFRDITKRRQSEKALLREQTETDRLKSLLEIIMHNMTTGLLVTNHQGEIILINRIGQEILGTSESESIGRPAHEVSPDIERFGEAVSPKGLTLEMSFKRPDGKVIPIGYSSSIFTDLEGRQAGSITVFKDLTEKEEIEKKLRENEKLATIGEIAGGIAHEIKNPLFAISSGIQLLQYTSKIPKDQKKTMEIIFQETMRVDRLIRQLLNYSIPRELKRTPVLTNNLIDEVVSLNRGLLEAKRLKIRSILVKDGPPILLDRDQISQVLINLLQNAIEASPVGERIEVHSVFSSDGQYLTVRIKDRGPGIPDELCKRVFDPFLSTKKGSSGMGLALSKRIILEHGGDIWIEPRNKRGAISVFQLPIILEDKATS